MQTLLEHEIDVFLLHVAKWTCQWFNKPKFHILLYFPRHIQRFGLAMLFATKAFESFNTVIHAKSVHSNRLSPSHDIALMFAQGNRVRHLLSGGVFNTWKKQADGTISTAWRTTVAGPLRLVSADNSTVAHYLGIESEPSSCPGKFSIWCKVNQSLLNFKHIYQWC